jgi:P-type Ca2+ transporter type 2C
VRSHSREAGIIATRSSGSSRPARARTPTATAGESAIGSHDATTEALPLPNTPNRVTSIEASCANIPSPTELNIASSSFESRESRLTSPRNASWPASRRNDSVLPVSGMHLRGISVSSEDVNFAATTFCGSTTPTSSAQVGTHGEPGLSIGNADIINDGNVLKPDPGSEPDFNVKDNKFAFSPGWWASS